MAPNKQLTRTCASCGLEKPLTAFLQITARGTSYGIVCASCRSEGAKIKKVTKEEDRSGIPTGQRIGAKEKAFSDKEQFRQIKDLKELYKKDLKKKDDLTREKSDKRILTEKLEKDHRKNYLERKRGFLNKKTEPGLKTFETTQQSITAESGKTFEIKKQQTMTDQEIRKVATHFSAFYHPIQEGRLEFHSEAFLRFINILGTATNLPMITMLAQFNKKLAALSDKKTPYITTTPQNEVDEKNETDLVDYAKQSWRPRRP